MAIFVNGAEVKGDVYVNGSRMGTMFIGSVQMYQRMKLVATNAEAYAEVAAGNTVYTTDKGELTLNASGVLQASDGSRLGKLMDVWFTSDAYALNAASFANGCYIKSDGRRVYDNKAWSTATDSTSTQTTSSYPGEGEYCAHTGSWARTVYNNITKWR